jgi:hypothetical protein
MEDSAFPPFPFPWDDEFPSEYSIERLADGGFGQPRDEPAAPGLKKPNEAGDDIDAPPLFPSEGTVKTHVASVLRKLGVRDRVHAVIYAYESEFVEPGVA